MEFPHVVLRVEARITNPAESGAKLDVLSWTIGQKAIMSPMQLMLQCSIAILSLYTAAGFFDVETAKKHLNALANAARATELVYAENPDESN